MNTDILQAIATGLVTILGFFMFYDSKKRTEAAKASQEEAKATAQYASGWKDLCERKDSELKAKDEKIDSLYDVLNQHRASEDKLKDENMELVCNSRRQAGTDASATDASGEAHHTRENRKRRTTQTEQTKKAYETYNIFNEAHPNQQRSIQQGILFGKRDHHRMPPAVDNRIRPALRGAHHEHHPHRPHGHCCSNRCDWLTFRNSRHNKSIRGEERANLPR